MYYKWPDFPKNCTDFVFDTNVLIDMYAYNIGETEESKENSKIFDVIKPIHENKHNVYIDNIVLGEFINKYIKFSMGYKFKQLGKVLTADSYSFRKIDRATKEYDLVLKELETILENIKDTFNIVWLKENTEIKPEDALSEMKVMEFNDYLIYSLTQSKKATLITRDNDLLGHPKINTLGI